MDQGKRLLRYGSDIDISDGLAHGADAKSRTSVFYSSVTNIYITLSFFKEGSECPS